MEGLFDRYGWLNLEFLELVLNPLPTFASGGQNPFYKKGFGFPKIFYKGVFLLLYFFALLRVSSRLKKNRRWILDFISS